jgi:hypothetical protein
VSHDVQVSVAPVEKVPGRHLTAAVLAAFALKPAEAVVQ